MAPWRGGEERTHAICGGMLLHKRTLTSYGTARQIVPAVARRMRNEMQTADGIFFSKGIFFFRANGAETLLLIG